MKNVSSGKRYRICLINTGGTISCAGRPLAPMSPEVFRQNWNTLIAPALESSLGVGVEIVLDNHEFCWAVGDGYLDSTDVQPRDWCSLAGRILDTYGEYDAWVVLHGTDTMAYTASALSFLLGASSEGGIPQHVLTKPIILTGSQVPLFADKTLRCPSDAFSNLCAAFAFACQPVPEVAVAFGEKLLRGNRTIKVDANRYRAFASPNYPVLGELCPQAMLNHSKILQIESDKSSTLDDLVTRMKVLDRLAGIERRINEVVVIPIKAFPTHGSYQEGVMASYLEATLALAPQVLILESYGSGNFPRSASSSEFSLVEEILRNSVSRGTVVINCTQCERGAADSHLYAAGSWLTGAGVVSGRDITLPAVLAKATIFGAEMKVSGNKFDTHALTEIMNKSIAGESQAILSSK